MRDYFGEYKSYVMPADFCNTVNRWLDSQVRKYSYSDLLSDSGFFKAEKEWLIDHCGYNEGTAIQRLRREQGHNAKVSQYSLPVEKYARKFQEDVDSKIEDLISQGYDRETAVMQLMEERG